MPAALDHGPALLRRVLDEPDDDAVRLVYADWLEQDADPPQPERAELIRVQVRTGELAVFVCAHLAQTPESPQKDIVLTLAACGVESGAFRRGFVEKITLPAADWLAHADALTAAHPVRAVRLTTAPELDYWTQTPLSDGKALSQYRITGDSRVVETQRWRFQLWWGQPERDMPPAEEFLAERWPGIAFTLPS